MSQHSVGVAVITHRARAHLAHCLPPLLQSPLRPRVLVVNSSSGDGTVEEAQRLGAETLVVPRTEFNHGLTRERARRHLATDLVVMLTPDAYPMGPDFLERLTAPLCDRAADVAYGRQIARLGADAIEAFGRAFNYPANSHLRSLDDWPQHGSYTHFCSNACAAWRNTALDLIGGFKATLVSEETIAAAELLARGHKIAYVADAVVVHSHRYGLADEFRRHFDVGYTRARFGHLLRQRERDEVRGRAFARALLRHLWQVEPRLVPAAAARLAIRWLGFQVGLHGLRLPPGLARRLSGQDYFWLGAGAARAAVEVTHSAA